MSPIEDDPAVWAALARFFRQVMEGLSFTTPFIGPAFVGAVLSATRKSYRRKGAAYWISAVCWSTAAGAVLTPAFAHLAGISGDIAGSTAALVAILGHESIGFLFRRFGAHESAAASHEDEGRDGLNEKAREERRQPRWDGVERRASRTGVTRADQL